MEDDVRSAQDYIDEALRPVIERFITENLPERTKIMAIHPTPSSIVVVFDIPHKFKKVK